MNGGGGSGSRRESIKRIRSWVRRKGSLGEGAEVDQAQLKPAFTSFGGVEQE